MSQQHAQSEEEFRDGPPAYQSGYTGPQPVSYTVNAPPFPSYTNMPGQKLVIQDLSTGKAPSSGQKLALAIVSLVFVFITFMITLVVVAAVRLDSFPMASLAVLFAFVFAVIALALNLIFNRKH